MAPIRVALIGLSASAKTGWAAGGHLPYLTSERGRQQYKIAALLNSSVDAAKKAIEAFDLGSDVKAYGKPQDLANDSDIQLAVAVTRVDVHYDTIKPSVAAGKDAFVEWPLAENAQRAGELADLAKQRGIKTLVGIQARVSPVVLKIKELIHSGRIGKVLSSQVSGCSPYVERYRVSEGLSYFLDKKIGGNPMSIGYAHSAPQISFDSMRTC
jgi:predicted dehydrogenase